MAADHGVLDSLPRIKLPSEKDRPQQRSVDPDEYQLILSNLSQPHQREQQRIIIGWHESAMRHQEILHLKWPMVDFKAGLLRLPAKSSRSAPPAGRRSPMNCVLSSTSYGPSNRRSATSPATFSPERMADRSRTSATRWTSRSGERSFSTTRPQTSENNTSLV